MQHIESDTILTFRLANLSVLTGKEDPAFHFPLLFIANAELGVR